MLKSAILKFVSDSDLYKAENMFNMDSSPIILQDFEALKNHSTSLLKQERELNTKLHHLLETKLQV